MATLNTDIRYIKGVGEARAKSLAKLGITDLRSLLSYFPRAYDDRRAYKKIADLIPGENACVCAVIAGEPKLSRIRKGLDLIKLRAVDETGALELTYFNQSYLKNTFHTGDAYVFFGRAEGTPSRPQMTNPLFEREGSHQITGRIMPIYPLTAGISSTAIVVLSRIMTVFSFALVMLRTLYAKWLYRKSAAERIRRIRAEFPDAAQRRAVLSAQGGVSIAGVIGAFVLLMVLGACATVLMGPNLDALAGMI